MTLRSTAESRFAGSEGFPETLWSAVLGAGTTDSVESAAALGRLCAVYRQPIYGWLRRAGYSHHAAEDAAHDFIHHLLRHQRLPPLNPSMGRFRSWLLRALRNLLRDQHDARVAIKRGGGAVHVSLGTEDGDRLAEAGDPALDRDVARIVHERSMDAVGARWLEKGHQTRFEVLRGFIRSDPGPGEYDAAGVRLGLIAKQVKRIVLDLRSCYSETYLAIVSHLTHPSDVAAEAKHLLSQGLPPDDSKSPRD